MFVALYFIFTIIYKVDNSVDNIKATQSEKVGLWEYLIFLSGGWSEDEKLYGQNVFLQIVPFFLHKLERLYCDKLYFYFLL
jgi:hypothetical protein